MLAVEDVKTGENWSIVYLRKRPGDKSLLSGGSREIQGVGIGFEVRGSLFNGLFTFRPYFY